MPNQSYCKKSVIRNVGKRIVRGDCVNPVCQSQEVTTRCRLSWLTNSALVYDPKRGVGVGGTESCGVSANEYICGTWSPNKL
jgi:hypothetical protein